MTTPSRKRVPLAIGLKVALRQIGFEPTEVELDHDPALALREINADGTDWIPSQHDARYLVWRPKDQHRVKTSGTKATTAGSDIHTIAKGKRLTRDQDEFRRRMLAKSGQSEAPQEPKRSRLASRPFPKQTRGFGR